MHKHLQLSVDGNRKHLSIWFGKWFMMAGWICGGQDYQLHWNILDAADATSIDVMPTVLVKSRGKFGISQYFEGNSQRSERLTSIVHARTQNGQLEICIPNGTFLNIPEICGRANSKLIRSTRKFDCVLFPVANSVEHRLEMGYGKMIGSTIDWEVMILSVLCGLF